jgi:hypothetical protein
MTDKITLNSLATFDNSIINSVNTNNATIVSAMDNTLSRDGTTPNQMAATLDMNSNNIINLLSITFAGLVTTDPHVSGQVWNNSGVLTVSAG